MSVIYLNETFLQNLAATISDVLNFPNGEKNIYYDVYTLSNALQACRVGLYKDFDAAVIQTVFAKLNYNAFKSAYKDRAGVFITPTYNKKTAQNIVTKYGEIAFLKRLQCFIYQCDESVNQTSDVLNALKDFERSVMLSIINKLPEYDAAAWSI